MSHRIEPAALLAEHGRTYAAQAGITLRDRPMPLFQLLVLTLLSANRIPADTAAATADELFRAGRRTPGRLLAASRQQRVDALGRGGYRRYDEGTASHLGELATAVRDELGGDLRRLRPTSADDVRQLERSLQRFPRVGPTGAAIFCREVQAVWPQVRPYFDTRATEAARRLGYPTSPGRLAALVADDQVAALSAALVRWSRHH